MIATLTAFTLSPMSEPITVLGLEVPNNKTM